MFIRKTIKKNKIDIVLLFATASFYLLNNFAFKKFSTGIVQYFFICYFNDLICPLGFLAYVNILLSFIDKKMNTLFSILIFCFLCGTIWEFIAPFLKEGSVTDFIDLLCYCIGGILYWIIKIVIQRGKRK